MNGDYAEYIEAEVLPRVEKNCEVKLTKDPDGRAAMGNSSGGSAALDHGLVPQRPVPPRADDLGHVREPGVAVRPEVPRRGLGLPRDAHPQRAPRSRSGIFISVGDKDLLNPNVMRDGMHDWVEANHRMAKVLKDKGYEYQYLFCRGAGHSVGNAQQQFLPHAIEWVWKGYAPKKDK